MPGHLSGLKLVSEKVVKTFTETIDILREFTAAHDPFLQKEYQLVGHVRKQYQIEQIARRRNSHYTQEFCFPIVIFISTK
jgi:hypothetical protein